MAAPRYGGPTPKLRVYPQVGSGRLAIFGMGQVQVSITGRVRVRVG